MKPFLIFLIGFWCIATACYAQPMNVDLRNGATIGETLPPISTQPVLFHKQDKIDLHDYTDKVLILDFFDTYCSNCIASMPKLQQLQEEMADKLQIVMVTWQDKATMEKFYASNQYLRENNVHLTTIYADTLLRKYFPHKGVPHTAWLYRGKVQAITYSDFTKAENVEELYANGHIRLPHKSDFNEGLAAGPTGPARSGRAWSTLSGYLDGVKSEGLKMQFDTTSTRYKSTIYNVGVFGAYTSTWSKIKKPEFLLTDARVVWKVRDSSVYKYEKGALGPNEWNTRNAISYERYDQVKRPDNEQAQVILHDLNAYLGMEVYWSTKEAPCLVIQRLEEDTKPPTPPQQESERQGMGMEGTGVLAFMIDYQGGYPPVVDEVGSMDPINISDYSSWEAMNRQLAAYGLVLREAIREIEVLVFEDR